MERIGELLGVDPLYGSRSRELGQDWDLQFADSERVGEFMDAYEQSDDDDFRYALMQLILVSFEDGLDEGPIDRKTWNRIASALFTDFRVHASTVWIWVRRYSSWKDSELGDLIREVWKKGWSESSPG